MIDPTALIIAIGTAIAGILTAGAALMNALHKMPRQTKRTVRLVTILERARDWLQAENIWEDVPSALRRDIDRALDQPDQELAPRRSDEQH